MASAIYYLLLSLFTVICFVPFAVLFALTVFFDKERVALHWASRVWSYGIFRLCPLWKLRVEGREKIDRSRPWVIVTNHQSMLDIPLMYVLPLNFKWVSKKEVQKMPISQDRVYRMFSAPLATAPAAEHRKIFDTDYYVEGYATTFNDPYELCYGIREQISPGVLDGADLTDVIMQYDHEGMVFARNRAGNLHIASYAQNP